MRMKLIDLFEKVEKATVNGEDLIIYRNPTRGELIAACKRISLRGLVNRLNGDTYWWNARKAIHVSVARQIGLEGGIYYKDQNARLELIKYDSILIIKIISGWQTAIQSASLEYLTSSGGITIQYNRQFVNFAEYKQLILTESLFQFIF